MPKAIKLGFNHGFAKLTLRLLEENAVKMKLHAFFEMFDFSVNTKTECSDLKEFISLEGSLSYGI